MLNTLEILQIPFQLVDICERDNLNHMRTASNKDTAPQLFYQNHYLMDYDEFFVLVENKRLKEQLAVLTRGIDQKIEARNLSIGKTQMHTTQEEEQSNDFKIPINAKQHHTHQEAEVDGHHSPNLFDKNNNRLK